MLTATENAYLLSRKALGSVALNQEMKMALPAAPQFVRVLGNIPESAAITLGTAVSGPVPANWVISWVGSSRYANVEMVCWNNVAALVGFGPGKTVQGVLTNGQIINSVDNISQDSEVTLVCAAGTGGTSTLSLYVDSGLDATATVPTPTSGGNAGALVVGGGSTVDSVRIFNAAIDPTTTDLFWFDEPGTPLPASLVLLTTCSRSRRWNGSAARRLARRSTRR